MKNNLLAFLLIIVFHSIASATAVTATFTATKSGNWNDPSVWAITGTNTNSHTYPCSAGLADTSTQHDAVAIPSAYIVTLTANSFAYNLALQTGAIQDGGFNLSLYQSGTTTSGSTPLTVTSSTNTGSFTGTGSIILTGHGYIKIYAGSGLTVDNLTISQSTAFAYWNNICALNSGNLIVTGTLTLNNSGVFCLGTKQLSLYKSITGVSQIQNTNITTGDGTSSLTAGTSVNAGGILAFKSTTVTFPPNLLSTSSSLTGLIIDVSAGNTYTLPGALTYNGKLNLTTGNFSTGANSLIINGTTNPITFSPGTSLIVASGGTANFNGNPITIQSDVTGSGAIGQVVGTLNGISNVTVQRYVGTNTQWRMIGFPLTAGTSISASALAALYSTGYNAYTYNEGADDETNYGNSGTMNAGWVSFTNPATIAANQGILMIGGAPTSTISATGPLNSGPQSIPLSKSKNGWNFIANPFACNINWTSIASNNGSVVNNAIYRYDPNSTAYSSYVNGSAAGALTQSNVIENGAGFFVQATTAGNLTIQESDKTTSAPAASLMGSNLARGSVAMDGIYGNTEDKSIISLSILKEGDIFADHLVLRWGVDPATDGFDGKYDAYDLGRKQGPDLSAVDNAGIKYSIFHGSALKTTDAENREIQLNVAQVTEGSYTISSQLLSPIANNNTIALLDHYNGTYTTLDNTNPSYTFNVTSDAASQSLKRFSLVFNPKATNTTVSSVLSVSLLNNPSTGNGFTLYSKENYNELQWQLVDNSGRSVQTGSINNVQNGGTYQVNTNASLQGMYFIKLIGDNKSLTSLKLIKE